MRVKTLHVRNFRALEDSKIELDKQTAILGGNGCGKSTFLRAMDRFYGQQSFLEADDFFGKEINRTVEIEMTFHDFNSVEVDLFASRIHDGKMTVTRVFEAGGGKKSGKYYGSTRKHLAFDSIRAMDGANEKKSAYNALRTSGGIYSTLISITKGEQIADAIAAWEQDNPDECELGRDDGQFFGFTNVAKGALQKFTSFVFVPAVRDASVDSMDAKGAVIARLMELVVRSAIQRKQKIKEFQTRISDEFRSLTDPEQLPELGGLAETLSATLKVFYNEAGVALKWRPVEEFSVPLPSADVFLNDDGFEGPVDRKGHGLQRAFIVTLLQHLARASSLSAEDAEKTEQPGGSAADQASAPQAIEMNSNSPSSRLIDERLLPGLILAIEEPELYQHPTKQRHFARVLSDLTSGALPGVAASTQIVFASHSALFVSMARFDQIRIARRCESSRPDVKSCKTLSADLEEIAEALRKAHQIEGAIFSADTLKARLHTLDSELAEGFFANLVVIVEGVSDRAAIVANAKARGVDLEANGIAVLCADGKTNIDRPAVIFRELGIPTFLVWDCDEKKKGQSESEKKECIATNKALQRICGVAEPDLQEFCTAVGSGYACFSNCLESSLREEIGEDIFLLLLDEVKSKYGVAQQKRALKVPSIVAEILERARLQNKASVTLDKIVDSIVAKRNEAYTGV